MSLSAATLLSLTFSIQPSGWALPNDPKSMWGNMLQPMSVLWAGEIASMESMLPQIDPRAATTLLPAWQRMLGPDACGLDLVDTTLQQQQLLAYQRLTGRGGQSVPYFLSLITAVGETGSIQEANWTRCGSMRTGPNMKTTRLGRQFMWQVNLANRVVTLFRTGASVCGDRLGSFSTSMAQCPIGHACPAHTTVNFHYSGTETH
jgi:uncharacterized protein YmfQ (DUF2313 family)